MTRFGNHLKSLLRKVGDANNDNKIYALDFSIGQSNYNISVMSGSNAADFDSSGKVDVLY